MGDGPLNSSKPTTSIVVGGVHNVVPPAPLDGQALPLQQDADGNLLVSVAAGGGGVASNVNIADVAGNPPALTNPLPVELSDGTNAFGTAGNPLSVAIVSGELSTVTVVQPTGTNLHVVVDSAPSTIATKATASNLNATIVGTGTATAPSGGVLTVQGPIQTGNAPTAATVGASSGIAVAANSSRTGLALVNTSANIISIAFGANAAVLYSGITLYPAGSLTLNILDGCQQAITAIASAAGSNLALQEMV